MGQENTTSILSLSPWVRAQDTHCQLRPGLQTRILTAFRASPLCCLQEKKFFKGRSLAFKMDPSLRKCRHTKRALPPPSLTALPAAPPRAWLRKMRNSRMNCQPCASVWLFISGLNDLSYETSFFFFLNLFFPIYPLFFIIVFFYSSFFLYLFDFFSVYQN